MTSSISRPCPFCGNPHTAASYGVVRCGQCGAAGPYGASDDAAISKWNHRAQTTVATPDGPGLAADIRSSPGATLPADEDV